MALFGEKCVRCGTRTRAHDAAGLPTCEDCKSKLQAEREEKRICPIDGAMMSKELVHNVIIDRCPSCSGVWLDRGELELIRQAVEAEHEPFGSGRFLAML